MCDAPDDNKTRGFVRLDHDWAYRQFRAEFPGKVLGYMGADGIGIYDVPPSFPCHAILDIAPAGPAAEAPPSPPAQDEFNRRTAALLHALVTIVVTRGLATPEQLERLTVAGTADIDQWSAEDRDRVQRGVRHLFDGLFPPN